MSVLYSAYKFDSRRAQRRRDSRDAVLSETVVQWAITTLQPNRDDVAALLKSTVCR